MHVHLKISEIAKLEQRREFGFDVTRVEIVDGLDLAAAIVDVALQFAEATPSVRG